MLALLPFLLPLLGARFAHGALEHRPIPAHPQDPFAVPKFEVAFLNHRPVGEGEARRWREGGAGEGWEGRWSGEEDGRGRAGGAWRTIDGAEGEKADARPNVVQLRLPNPSSSNTSLDSYLCLVPSPAQTVPLPSDSPLPSSDLADDSPAAATAIGWKSLAHLEGKCLYTRQGWFSYSYCHNSHVRQFREAPHAHPHPPGGFVPVEDHDFQAYNLGLSPALVKKYHADDAAPPDPPADPSTPPPSLSVSRNAHARYLTQTWGAGTTCDKTGRPRRIEVQFHCKMGGIDHIGFIKEVATCRYVLVVHTPNLCALPGFSSPTPHDAPVHPVQCRRIVPDDELAGVSTALEDQLREEEHEHIAFHDREDGLALRPESERDAEVREAVRERLVSGDRWPAGYYPTNTHTHDGHGGHVDAPPPQQAWDGETLLASDNLEEVVAAVLQDFDIEGADEPQAIEVEINGATYRIDLGGLADAADAPPAPPPERERKRKVPKLKNELKELNDDLEAQARRIREIRARNVARRREEEEDAAGQGQGQRPDRNRGEL